MACQALALTLELAPVRVNAVTLGLIDTPLLHTTYAAEHDASIKNRAVVLPGKRVGTAEEVLQVILMLMTNDYLTGEVVHVDGGGHFMERRSSDPIYVHGQTMVLCRNRRTRISRVGRPDMRGQRTVNS